MPFEPPHPGKVILISLGTGLIWGIGTSILTTISLVEDERIKQFFDGGK